MQARCDSWLSVVVAIAASNATIAVAQGPDAPNRQTSPDDAQRLLQAVAADEVFDGDAALLIPVLMELVTRGDQQESDLAIRGLGGLKSKAAQAVPVLCLTLDSSSHSTRSTAVDALVAIGDQSVAPLQELLRADSPRTRAAAVEALGRMDRMRLSDLERLSEDVDPRVRAAVATALSRLGRSGVARLASLLRDPELGVAVEAARGLQSNRDDPDLAIPRLIEAISRKELAWAAATALADYGIDARRAVPVIIKAYPLGRGGAFGSDNAAEMALDHIGPPDERDLSAMCECLTHENAEARILAAKSLALMGEAGRSAVPALEAATQLTIEESLKVERRFESIPYDFRDNSGRLFVAAEYLAAAVWHVTHDADQFVRFIERTVSVAERGIDFSYPSPWAEFSLDDCRAMERMLRSTDTSVQFTGLKAVSDIGARAESLKDAVLELACGRDDAVSRQAIWALASIGPKAGPEAVPRLWTKLRDGVISLQDFAYLASEFDDHSDEARALLERGLHDQDGWTAVACAKALCRTSQQADRTAAMIVDAARKGSIDHRNAIEALQQLNPAPESVIPYLVEQIQNNDYWTRHDALDAVGEFGRSAAPAMSAVRERLDDEGTEVRLAAAKALYQITGDTSRLEQELDAVLGGDELMYQSGAIKTITDLGPSGTPFMHYVTAALKEPHQTFVEELIEALQAVGSAEAVAALEQTAQSNDWILRSNATAVLRQLRDSGSKGDD